MKPMQGVKVLELGTLIAGPFCTRILGEFGADVVKVESPDGGDPLRQWRKLHQGTSLWWSVQARNKKSLTANLKHPEGLAIVRQLAAEADIVVENFRPGVLEKLGLGWDVLSAANPGLVMVVSKNGWHVFAVKGQHALRHLPWGDQRDVRNFDISQDEWRYYDYVLLQTDKPTIPSSIQGRVQLIEQAAPFALYRVERPATTPPSALPLAPTP